MTTSFGDLYHDLCRAAKSGEHSEQLCAIFPQSVLILSQNGVFMLSEAENISMLIHTLLACLEIT